MSIQESGLMSPEPNSAEDRPSISFEMVQGVFKPRLGSSNDEHSHGVSRIALGQFEADGFSFALEKTVLFGPREEEERLVIGIFAGIHGDEPVGPLTCARLYQEFIRRPDRFAGYELHLYPVCNPWGMLFSRRENADGHDLNRRFWIGASDAEIGILEGELERQRYHGLISLHADSSSHGVYGYTQRRYLNEDLLKPALLAAGQYFPINLDSHIDGFHASGGMIKDCFPGVLRPPPRLQGHPFEIIFETPGKANRHVQTLAACAAVKGTLAQYKRFLAKGWGI